MGHAGKLERRSARHLTLLQSLGVFGTVAVLALCISLFPTDEHASLFDEMAAMIAVCAWVTICIIGWLLSYLAGRHLGPAFSQVAAFSVFVALAVTLSTIMARKGDSTIEGITAASVLAFMPLFPFVWGWATGRKKSVMLDCQPVHDGALAVDTKPKARVY